MRDVKKALATLLAVATLSSASPAKAEYGEPELMEVDAPVVNPYVTCRTRVSDITLEDALSQLVTLAKEADAEESWIYLHDDMALLEVGILEEPTSVKYRSSDVVKYAHEEVTQIHLHPTQGDEEEFLKKRMGGMNLMQQRYARTVGKSITAIPSAQDLYSMMLMYQKMSAHNAGIELRHIICSEHGVTEYTLTHDGREYVKDLGKEQLKELAGMYHEFIHDVYDRLDVCTEDAGYVQSECPEAEVAKVMEFVEKQTENPYFKIHFRTAED